MYDLSRLVAFVLPAMFAIVTAVMIWRKLTPRDERRTSRLLFLAALPVPAVIQFGTIPLHHLIYEDNAALGSYTSILSSEVSMILAIYLLVFAAAFALPLWPFVVKLVAWPKQARSILRTAFLSAAGVQLGGIAATFVWLVINSDPGESTVNQPLNLTVLVTLAFSTIGELISLAGELAIVLWLGIRARRWVVGSVAGYSLSLFRSSAIWLLPKSILPAVLPPLDLSIYTYIYYAKTFVAAFISVAILSWIFVQSDDDLDVGQASGEQNTTPPDTATSTP